MSATNIKTPRTWACVTVTNLTKPVRVRTVPASERPEKVPTDKPTDPRNYRGADWSEVG